MVLHYYIDDDLCKVQSTNNYLDRLVIYYLSKPINNIKDRVLNFTFLVQKTGNLMTKSLKRSFYQCLRTKNDCRSL